MMWLLVYVRSCGFCAKDNKKERVRDKESEIEIAREQNCTTAAAGKHPSKKWNDLRRGGENEATKSFPYRQAPEWILLIDRSAAR